ncbi:MAG: hypothetical protein AB3N11_04645 [Arenibacterium sp.]
MNIVRSKPATPHTTNLSIQLNQMSGHCVGCSDCNGLCAELLDALMIPDIVLAKKRETQ